MKDITLPAGLTSFQDDLSSCYAGYFYATDLNPDGSYIYTPDGAIYYNNYKTAADALLANSTNTDLKNRNFLYLCNVTFDANGGSLTDSAEVPVYKTEKITETKANELTAIHDPTRPGYKFTGWYTEDGKDSKLFNVKDTAIMEDITLHAGWEFDPNAPGCHPLTVTGGTVTVKYDGSDVTSKLNSKTDATTGQKTYSVPDGAEVTVTLDKTAVPNGKVFDGWSTSLPTGQDCKAETITFPMSNGVNVSAKYRDAATDHTPDTAVCHPLTVTGGIVTVKNGDKDVTDTLTVTTDETTGKKTYSVPDGATVTVTLDKTLIPEGMVFDIWSTGKFSLPLGQDYKAETITFTMNTMSSGVDIAAQYRDATIEDDGPNVLGTAAIIGTAAVGTAVLGYQAYSLGAEFAGKLMALPYFPSNRSALAMMLWEDAGKPMPESELLYPDVGQEERDMDLQHAARWAMENELIPDLNDEGTAPEEMKFFPANPVSKLDVLNAWQKAQELKNN
ncbi:InlB B-repeat-containing protein [Faecalibacterium duncaniae]|uniref:InlB B-repeat-containing protein n=1 Tax=Faecalibacterium duncaniae (strain DSM 17677 / JCM 31915 / A2-165) TaxID=411483 RepID=UPI0020A00C68|nr:InlB B-repeat-containing protein [Faecalibacterium duncaniae]UTB41441.1 InlB B-repeat-containing protein [Faecalibacterium duncaniae]